MAKKKPKKPSNTIIVNKKVKHDYHLEEKFEAGISLLGWEVKSLRQGKIQLTDSYVFVRDGEAWLLNANIVPLPTVSTHFVTEPTRNRKLLLNKKELARLHRATQAEGKTCVCTAMYWKGHLVKVEIYIAQGKKLHDKRETEKQRDWNREKQRVLQDANR